MPVIPAWLVRSKLNDPRNIPYLLVWKDERHDGKIMEVVRLACCVAHDSWGHVELKRADESTTVLRIVWRMLPRNGGRALFLLCPHCDTPRRHVYGWEWDNFSGWKGIQRAQDQPVQNTKNHGICANGQASVRAAAMVNPGDLRNCRRAAQRTSWNELIIEHPHPHPKLLHQLPSTQ